MATRCRNRDELRSKLLPAAPDRYRAIIATAAGAGLRRGEAAGLRLDAVDVDRARLSVIRTVVEVIGTLTIVDDDTVRAGWIDATGATLTKDFPTEREAVLHIARSCAGGLRFHDLRPYATWLVDDEVPVNMVHGARAVLHHPGPLHPPHR